MSLNLPCPWVLVCMSLWFPVWCFLGLIHQLLLILSLLIKSKTIETNVYHLLGESQIATSLWIKNSYWIRIPLTYVALDWLSLVVQYFSVFLSLSISLFLSLSLSLSSVIYDLSAFENEKALSLRVKATFWSHSTISCTMWELQSLNPSVVLYMKYGFFFFFLAVLEFELRASCLLGRRSIAWTTPPVDSVSAQVVNWLSQIAGSYRWDS
jgi:hypothetical protein